MRRQELHPLTAIINKTQKNISKKARLDALQWLAIKFPDAFDTSVRIRPLKVGIMEDILKYADEAKEAGISRSKLREALVLFTRRIDYLTCLKARETRVDLKGNPVLEIDEQEAEKAAMKIKKRIEKSARNARKLYQAKNSSTHYPVRTAPRSAAEGHVPMKVVDPYYVERPPLYSSPVTASPAKPATVVVRKTARPFDPVAIARLKEKLGLSRQAEQLTETAEQ